MIGRVNVAGRGEGPAYSVEKWCKVVGLTYSDISDISEQNMRILMSKHASADYFMEWYSADNAMLDMFTVNESAMKWIGLNDYICDKLLAISDAESRLLASEFWAYILKDHVPIMTANDAPYGTAFASNNISGQEAYKAFDGDSNTAAHGDSSFSTTSGDYVGYSFVNPICIKRLDVKTGTGANIQVRIEATNNISGSWENLGEFSLKAADGLKSVDASNDAYFLHYRIYQVSSTAGNVFPISTLQFYGRSLNVSESSAPTDGRPYKLIESVYYTVDYSDRTEKMCLYDYGLELVALDNSGAFNAGTASDDGFTKNADSLSYTMPTTLYHDRAIGTDAMIDMTPYTKLCMVSESSEPYGKRVVDISNVNESAYVAIMVYKANSSTTNNYLALVRGKADMLGGGRYVAGGVVANPTQPHYIHRIWLE